jgi:hypothetical protein
MAGDASGAGIRKAIAPEILLGEFRHEHKFGIFGRSVGEFRPPRTWMIQYPMNHRHILLCCHLDKVRFIDPAIIQLRINPKNCDRAVVKTLPQLQPVAGTFKLKDFAFHTHRTKKFANVLGVNPVMFMTRMADPKLAPTQPVHDDAKLARDCFHKATTSNWNSERCPPDSYASVGPHGKSQPFYGLKFDGRSFDCGSKVGFLTANVAYGLARRDLAPAFRQELREMLQSALPPQEPNSTASPSQTRSGHADAAKHAPLLSTVG